MNKAIEEHNWDICFNVANTDHACNIWNESFLNIARTYIPNKVVKIRTKDKPWFNNKLRKLLRQKNKMHKNAKYTNSVVDWEHFRECRNKYTEHLRSSEKNYKNLLANKLNINTNINPKGWWHLARQFMGKTKDSQIPPMTHGNNDLVDNLSKANAFNEAFLSFSNIDTSNASLPRLTTKTNSKFEKFDICEKDIYDVLKSLDTSKATGPDGISSKMLKETALSITPSLTRLIKLSISTASVPKCWKQANVLPIYKKGEKSDFGNYRPVSLLNVTSKVCEKVIFKYLFNYFRDNNQSGFIQGDSTVHQLVFLYNTFCKALDDKKDIRIVFCDQSKAFDRVWHAGLIFKLQSQGVKGEALLWIKDYLANRQQRVVIEGNSSSWGNICAGVPQGSVLGPLLFLVYINDITEHIKSQIKLFADDTSLFITIDDNIEELSAELNEDLNTIGVWAKNWLVNFNASKSKVLNVTLKRNFEHLDIPLKFEGEILDTVHAHKHLGIEFNSKLTWKNHVLSISSNANKKISILAGLKNFLDRKTLSTMYISFIRPTLEYGNIVWCNCTSSEDDILESVQRRAARIITGAIIRTPSKCIYEEAALETLKCRQERNILLFFHKIINKSVPLYLQNLTPESTHQERYNLRHQSNFIPPKCRITKYQKSFLPTAVSLWNKLEEDQKNITDFKSFKKSITPELYENPLHFIGNRKEQILMSKIRLNCSNLKAHLYNLKIINDRKCTCGLAIEDSLHFFFICTLYNRPRATLHNCIAVLAPFTLKTLLNGYDKLDILTNTVIIKATLEFINATERFKD